MALKLNKDTKFVAYTEKHGFILDGNTISEDAFRENVDLESVMIPDGITRILEGSFEGCSNLTTIIIPASVKVIEQNAFVGCNSLESVILDDDIVEMEHWFSRGAKITVSRKDLVETLKRGEEVKLLTENDIDHWA